MCGERLTCGKIDILRKRDGQVLFGNRHESALVAVDGGNGVSPVALAGDEPVAQTELHRLLPLARGLQVADDRVNGGRMLAADHAGVLAGLHELALGLVGFLPVDRGDDAILLVFELRIERIILTQDDGDDGQVVLAGELEVALVAARDGHNRAGAVVGHDVVGDPHGDLLAVHRVHDVAAGKRAVLLAVALGALDGAYLGSGLHKSHDVGLVLGAGNELGHELAFGSEQEEAASEERVGARREHGDRLAVVFALGGKELEVDLGAFRTPDPVRLHLLHALGPAVELVEIIEQLLRVVGDLEVPLREVALLDSAVAAPAFAFRDLLVCENGLAVGAPVHRRLAALDKPALPELQKDPLAPTIVLGVARNDRAVPIVGQAHALEGRLLRLDVRVRPFRRVAVMLDGGVLGWQTESIPPHGVKHIEAAHLRVTGDHVADRVVAHMPHVDIARRIREHLEHVLLGLRFVFSNGIQT